MAVPLDEINELLEHAAIVSRDEPIHEIAHAPEQTKPRAFSEFEANDAEAGRFLLVKRVGWRGLSWTKDGVLFTDLEKVQYCATTYTEGRAQQEPPRQEGDRWTRRLSDRARKEIERSAKYTALMRRGFRTFLTLTFTERERALIRMWDELPRTYVPETENNPDFVGPVIPKRETIGKLVTRFLNVLQQRHRNGKTFGPHMYRADKQKKGGCYKAKGTRHTGTVHAWSKSARWTPVEFSNGFQLRQQSRPFDFVWVIENPWSVKHSAYGPDRKRNPHVHILMNWHVKRAQFHAWAGWIETTWGKGFAKLEKIRKPWAAGRYMAKAANYLSKGGNGAQGPVRGNRYNISKNARAPKDSNAGRFFADWITDAIKLGVEAGAERWPENIWFHRYGFGANTRDAWALLWRTLKADGFKLREVPTLWAARLGNAGAALMRQIYDFTTQANETLAEQLAKFGEWLPALSFAEFQQQHEDAPAW